MSIAPTQITILTPNQQKIVDKMVAVIPPAFLATTPPGMARNIRLLGLIGLALADINNTNPRTGYTVDNFPTNQYDFLVMATMLWVLLFEQARYSLADISYSENGYSITLDRTSKIGTAFANFEKMYTKQLDNFKNGLMLTYGGTGLASARYQSNLSKFLSILGGGSAYGWNVP